MDAQRTAQSPSLRPDSASADVDLLVYVALGQNDPFGILHRGKENVERRATPMPNVSCSPTVALWREVVKRLLLLLNRAYTKACGGLLDGHPEPAFLSKGGAIRGLIPCLALLVFITSSVGFAQSSVQRTVKSDLAAWGTIMEMFIMDDGYYPDSFYSSRVKNMISIKDLDLFIAICIFNISPICCSYSTI
jgi:hypothetical protein